MSKMTSKKEISGKNLKMVLGGILDEDADFKDIGVAGFDVIDIDLNDLKSINSCGIREWIKWLSTNSTAQIHFANCPKVIVDQINMVDGFLPKNASVKSFFVPYFNDELGSEKNVLYREGSEFTGNQIKHPASVKDDDGNDMEMDVIESKYFRFITARAA